MDKFYALGDVARLLNVQGYKIAYAISTGALPDASCRLANKRVFTSEDVQRIARYFGVDKGTLCGDGGSEGDK
jgi:hypothetical protein